MGYFRAAIAWFIERGFALWELNNRAHFDLRGQGRGVRRMAGSKLNLRNSAAFAQAIELGCRLSVVSLEITREELTELAQKKFSPQLVITLYCRPPLFTLRLIPTLKPERPFFSARNEAYHLITKRSRAQTYADRPVSWLEQLPVLRSPGYANFPVDVAPGPERRPGLMEALNGIAGSSSSTGYSFFNFERKPMDQRDASKKNK